MDVMIPRCARLDVHQATVVATVRVPGDDGTPAPRHRHPGTPAPGTPAPGTRHPGTLFIPERCERVEPRGPACGDVGGKRAGGGNDRGH